MKISKQYKVRKIAGENIVVAYGVKNVDLTTVISLNTTALQLWENFENQEFTASDVEIFMQQKYEIDENLAKKDAKKWIDSLMNEKIIIA